MENSVIDFILKKDCGMFECIEYNEAYKNSSAEENRVYGEFVKTLNEEQKEQFEKIIDLHLSQECESSEIFFKEGVKVGLRFAAECLID